MAQAGVHVVDGANEGLIVLEGGNQLAALIGPGTLTARLDFQSALLADDQIVPITEDDLGLAADGFQQVGRTVGIANQGVLLIHLLLENEAAHVVPQILEILLHAGVEHEAQAASQDVVLQHGSNQIAGEHSSQHPAWRRQ